MKSFHLFKYRESLGSKIFLIFSFLTVFSTIVFSTFFYRYQSRSLTEKLVSRGELLSALLAHNSRLGVFTENEELLNTAAEGILENDGTLSASIFSSEGKVLLLRSGKGIKKAPDDAWDPSLSSMIGAKQKSLLQEKGGDFAFWSRVTLKPVMSEEESVYFGGMQENKDEQTIGFARVILDGEQLRRGVNALLLDSIIICLVFLVIGAVVTFIISESVTRHLNRLTAEVRNFSGGRGYKEISVTSEDEIGKLASAFNELVESLKQREEEKEELEEKLRHSQKMEAVGTLAGGVAHDFNNILMAINGYSALMQLELEEDSKLWSYADQIIKAGERAANLTQRLLTFTRKQIISPKPVVLDDAVKNIEKLLIRLITEDIEMSLRLGAGNAVILVDPGQLDQVLINLVTNSRDAMPHGGRIVISTDVINLDQEFVRLHEQLSEGLYALLTVSDNGCGIPEELINRIFDPFFTTKEVGKGTGLGLSMVYGIVKQHNGIILVDSVPGEGTDIKIYIPLLKMVVKEQDAKATPLTKGHNETILVAEDDESVMGFIKGLLEVNGYRVIGANNGDNAIEEFRSHLEEISLVLLDVIMPGRNGKEVYDELLHMKPDVKAIFISGYTSDVIDLKCSLEKELHLIHKPVQPATLLIKVREVLDNSQRPPADDTN